MGWDGMSGTAEGRKSKEDGLDGWVGERMSDLRLTWGRGGNMRES
jgi:hypothetical protein